MSLADEVLQVFPDGHEICQDSRQKIVKHPQGCVNAKRGNLLSQYAKYTYFTSEVGFQAELRACHLIFSAARTTQVSRLDNGRSDEKRAEIRPEALGGLESRPTASTQGTQSAGEWRDARHPCLDATDVVRER